MRALFRSLLLAVAIILSITLFTSTVQAATWSSTSTSGFTAIESMFLNGTYTWLLHNNSSPPRDAHSNFDILVWELVPFQVHEPRSWAAPDGWEWDGSGFKLLKTNAKYRTPYALEPGRSFIFSYTPNPQGRMVNSKGPQPEGLSFTTHVAAVIPKSGSGDGSVPWVPIETSCGRSWFDAASTFSAAPTVPEPKGLIIMGVGIISMGSFVARRLKRYRLWSREQPETPPYTANSRQPA